MNFWATYSYFFRYISTPLSCHLLTDTSNSSISRLTVFQTHRTHPFLVDKGRDGLFSSSSCSRLHILNQKLDMQATIISFSFSILYSIRKFVIARKTAGQSKMITRKHGTIPTILALLIRFAGRNLVV